MTYDPPAAELAALRAANLAFGRRYPGASGARQPVHTVYGGAHLFAADTARKVGAAALRSLEEYARGTADFGHALGLSGHPSLDIIHERVVEKLRAEPVEDYRADFEDGYGTRPDAEEDEHAVAVAEALADGMARGTLPAGVGIRIKPLGEETRERGLRTLALVLRTLAERAGALPERFVVTLPKVTVLEQVDVLVATLGRLERTLGLPEGAIRVEVMVETPQLLLGPDGGSPLGRLPDRAAGRLAGAHFGTYDYTAALGITAAHQRMRHPACDFAKHAMQAALAGTGVWLSDGATTTLPVPLHRAPAGSAPLAETQRAENRAAVHHAWRLHYDDVRHSLAGGFYQGWDLHPAQLVSRYAAVYAFFIEGTAAAAARLRNFLDRAAQATLVGTAFDDAATGQGLLNFFLRAAAAGALTEPEVARLTGLSADELRGRSFARIVEARRSSS